MGRYQFGDIGLVRLLYSGLGQVFAMTAGLVVGAGLLHAYRLDTSTFVLLCAAIVLTIVRVATIQSFQWLSRDLTQPAAARWEILYGACAVATGLVVADMTLESFHNGTPGLQLLSLGLSFALCNGQSSVRVASRIWIALASGWIVLGALAIACFMLDDPTVKVTGGLVVLYAFAYTASCRNSSQTLLGRLEAEQELARLARADVLTALGNRRAFEEELKTQMVIPAHPELTGAVGAALLAGDEGGGGVHHRRRAAGRIGGGGGGGSDSRLVFGAADPLRRRRRRRGAQARHRGKASG